MSGSQIAGLMGIIAIGSLCTGLAAAPLPAGCRSDLVVAPGRPEVLTLSEAADLLRVDALALATAADRGEVPGRYVMGRWRFSRLAVLAWLAGVDDPSHCFDAATAEPAERLIAPPGALQPLSRAESAATVGAGRRDRPVAQMPSPPANVDRPAPDRLGEPPSNPTAEEIALRAQGVLLRAGYATLEPGFFYSRDDRDELLPPGVLGQRRLETSSAVLTARYGLTDRLELLTSASWQHRDDTASLGGVSLSDSGRNEFGDVALGARYALRGEGVTLPAVVVSLDGRIPTNGTNGYGLGGGLFVIKSIDPVALFASAEYLHTFSPGTPTDLSRIEREDLVTARAGFAFAMNDRLSFSAALDSAFGSAVDVGTVRLASEQNYALRLALTALLTENTYIEPSVSFRLNGPGSGFLLGLSIPYTFRP